jgi:thioredoxin
MVEHVTVETFPTKVLTIPHLVVIDIWATWCRPCHAMAPIFNQIAQQFSGKAHFLKLNADENPELVRRYSITSIPTLLYFSHGKCIDRKVGLQSAEAILQRLTPLLSLSPDEASHQEMQGLFSWSKCQFWA